MAQGRKYGKATEYRNPYSVVIDLASKACQTLPHTKVIKMRLHSPNMIYDSEPFLVVIIVSSSLHSFHIFSSFTKLIILVYYYSSVGFILESKLFF